MHECLQLLSVSGQWAFDQGKKEVYSEMYIDLRECLSLLAPPFAYSAEIEERRRMKAEEKQIELEIAKERRMADRENRVRSKQAKEP